MVGGSVVLVLSTVVAGEGVKWWHFFLCQGIATGVGMGLVFGAGMALVEAMGLEMEGWERGVVGVGGGVGKGSLALRDGREC